MPMRDLWRGLSEVRRGWSYSVALLDYTQIFYSRSMQTHMGGGGGEPVENRMGAFVWNDSDAMKLFNANLPVFYIQPYRAFDRQVIQSAVSLSLPQICMVVASPPYPILLSNCQAGSNEKFAAIRAATISCFDVQSPFENMHLPGAYASSFSLSTFHKQIRSPSVSVPSTSSLAGVVQMSSSSTHARPYTKSHKALQAKKQSGGGSSGTSSIAAAQFWCLNTPFTDLPTQSQPSHFEDLAIQSPLLPPLLPSCRGINTTINA
ncbi:hypothetical protein E1B28_006841 [Marasmius oreades]|uniref:Uncharacterized protein n=1 Tax=Marasmius oreades TaxID=181124 RepID=A0A9P7UX06_9AGAR|nr:uncharacterized protein E1B28_006841 [Marasmius oreades]KAG7096168.1 hypothetical protein E1B28_006841 [Marasmius oreades]